MCRHLPLFVLITALAFVGCDDISETPQPFEDEDRSATETASAQEPVAAPEPESEPEERRLDVADVSLTFSDHEGDEVGRWNRPTYPH